MREDRPTVVITGGEGDLGQALVREFEVQTKAQNHAHTHAVQKTGWNILAPSRHDLDVCSEESVTRFFASLTRLDLLIHNAGVIDDHPLVTLQEVAWDRVLKVHLRGGFLSARAALPFLRQRGGHIILIGSRAARHGTAGQSHYAAAKAGLIGLAQSLAREEGRVGIRCNVVFPGFLETRMTASLPPAVRERALQEHQLGRFNTLEQAARGIAQLAQLDHVSGQVFQLDSRIDSWT